MRTQAQQALEQWEGQTDGESVEGRLRELVQLLDQRLPSADDSRERWMAFREQVSSSYEGLAEALSSCHVELPSLRPTNYARSASHAFSGVLALLMVELLPWSAVSLAAIGMFAAAWTMELTRRFSESINELLMSFFGPIAHAHERYKVNSATWYVTALLLLSFTGQPVVCAAAVLALGFGDPAAALVGRKFGTIELVYNRTLEGTLTFVAVAFGTIFAALAVFHAPMSLTGQLLVAGLGGIAGALAELFSHRIDDNFAIPIATGIAVWGLLLV
jgi:dolichol kinase